MKPPVQGLSLSKDTAGDASSDLRLLPPAMLVVRELKRAGERDDRRIGKIEGRGWNANELTDLRVTSRSGNRLQSDDGDAELGLWIGGVRGCLSGALTLQSLAFAVDCLSVETPADDAAMASATLQTLFEEMLDDFHRAAASTLAVGENVLLRLRRGTATDGDPPRMLVIRCRDGGSLGVIPVDYDYAALKRFEDAAKGWLVGVRSFEFLFSTPVPTAHQRAAAKARGASSGERRRIR